MPIRTTLGVVVFGLSPFELTRYRIETQGHRRGLDSEQIDRAVLFSEIFYGLLAGPEVVEWSLVALKARRWPDEPWSRLVEIVPAANHLMTVGDPMAEFAPDYPGVVIRWLDFWSIDRARPR